MKAALIFMTTMAVIGMITVGKVEIKLTGDEGSTAGVLVDAPPVSPSTTSPITLPRLEYPTPNTQPPPRPQQPATQTTTPPATESPQQATQKPTQLSIEWVTWEKARESDKPIWCHYTNHGCIPCQKLITQSFQTQEVIDLSTKFSCVHLQPQPGGIAPSDVFMTDPKIIIYKGQSPTPSQFHAHLQSMVNMTKGN